MEIQWKFGFECRKGKLFSREQYKAIEPEQIDYAQAYEEAEQIVRQEYSRVTPSTIKNLRYLNDDAPDLYEIDVDATHITKGPTSLLVEISASEEEEAKALLWAFLKKQGFRELEEVSLQYKGENPIYSASLKEKVVAIQVTNPAASKGRCAACIHCIKEAFSYYCALMTKRRFGEETLVEVDRNGICDHYEAKTTKENAHYRQQ